MSPNTDGGRHWMHRALVYLLALVLTGVRVMICGCVCQTFAEAAALLCTTPGAVAVRPNELEFIRYPIVDGLVGPDSAVSQLVTDLCKRVRKGRVLYIHCMGGHG